MAEQVGHSQLGPSWQETRSIGNKKQGQTLSRLVTKHV